jgi:hypothetical protein
MAAGFAAYMRSLGASPGIALKHILTGFDWGCLGKANIVDVGYSSSSLASY